MSAPRNQVFVALDTPDLDTALAWARAVEPHVGGLKIGLEFVSANGPAGIEKIVALGRDVFLDVKYHDIPNTVAGAVRASAGLGVKIVNIHADGGSEMMRQAVAARDEVAGSTGGTSSTGGPRLIGVTVLTSMDEADLADVGQRGPIAAQAARLAQLSADCGLDGVVCSAHEISDMRGSHGAGFLLVVPGIRPSWAVAGDQKRVMTPRQAVELGADVLVIGRPITQADDPAAAAARIAEELDGAG